MRPNSGGQYPAGPSPEKVRKDIRRRKLRRLGEAISTAKNLSIEVEREEIASSDQLHSLIMLQSNMVQAQTHLEEFMEADNG